MRKLLGIFLVICLGFCFVGCEPGGDGTGEDVKPVLETPTNVKISELGNEGMVEWTAVPNAESYIVTINGTNRETANTYYYLETLSIDYTITVVACAEGYENSPSSAAVQYEKRDISVGIKGKSEIGSGMTSQLTAMVSGTDDKAVTWEITRGGEFATINKTGLVTAAAVTGDKIVTVKATSVADTSKSATKVLTITAKPELTQSMLDALAVDKIGFEGFLVGNIYTHSYLTEFVGSVSSDVKTAMDGTHWYAKFMNAAGGATGLYCQNNGGKACYVNVNLMNEISYSPVEDNSGNEVTWADAGLYNNFKNLNVSDFTFNNDTWRYEYSGSDSTFIERVVAAANPYAFEPKTLSLIVEDGSIAGFYSEAKPDYNIAGYQTLYELTVAVNTGDIVEVPMISQYDETSADLDPLKNAIAKMRALNSYTTELLDSGVSTGADGYTFSGYIETIETGATDSVCHFEPYTFTPLTDTAVAIGSGTHKFTGESYGYAKRADSLYNSYRIKSSQSAAQTATAFEPVRAYTGEIADAMPSFAFSPAVFTSVVYDADEKTYTYYVDEPMCSVASTFYRGIVGDDLSLYGLFAMKSPTSDSTPYLVVGENGYIVKAGFFYYLGSVYGNIEITYSDFDSTVTDPDVVEALNAMPTRQMPGGWEDLELHTTIDIESTANVVNALDYLKEFSKKNDIADVLPFFGDVLGDAYNYGYKTFRIVGTSVSAVCFCYDVPIDYDLSIGSSVAAVETLLTDNGYARVAGNYYVKDGVAVQADGSDIQLMIYVWNTTVTP